MRVLPLSEVEAAIGRLEKMRASDENAMRYTETGDTARYHEMDGRIMAMDDAIGELRQLVQAWREAE